LVIRQTVCQVKALALISTQVRVLKEWCRVSYV
jgi:hypothetical protein